MTLTTIYEFATDDWRARLTWNDAPYRAVNIQRDSDGDLSVWVVRVNKRTGADFRRPNSYMWLTLKESLERFGGMDLALYVRDIVAERTQEADIATAFDLAQLESACRTMLAIRNADWSTVDAQTKRDMIRQTMRDHGAADIVARHRAAPEPADAPEVAGIEIRTADVEWIERRGFRWRDDYVTNSRYYLVTVPATVLADIEHVTFSGRDMVRATITGSAPNDHNPNILVPFGYVKFRHTVRMGS